MAPDDFFDEEWEEPSRTQDTAVTRPQEGSSRRAGRATRMPRPPRTPRRPRPGGEGPAPQWGRLAALAVAIIVLLLIIVWGARSCGGSSAQSANQKYFDGVKAVLRTSQSSAAQLHATLGARALPLKGVEGRLRRALATAQKAQSQAAALDPTKQVKPYQTGLEIAMGYRVNGFSCLVQAMPTAWGRRRAIKAGKALVPCMQRLLASDVVYSDSFAAPSTRALSKASLDVQVPTSTVMRPQDEDLLTARGIGAVVAALHPAAVAKGLHGLALDSVKAEPGGKTLQPGSAINTVKASDNLAFVVTATNGGNFEEVNVPVRVTISRNGSTLKGSATIARIAKKQTLSVTVKGIVSGQTPPSFGVSYKMHVEVVPVPGERTASNNGATYTIVFTL